MPTSWEDLVQTVENSDDKVRVLYYGAPGVGKTQLAATFPEPFFIDVDHGMRTIIDLNKKHPEIKVPPYISLARNEDNYKVVLDIIDKFNKGEGIFKDKYPTIKTLVLDGVTSLSFNLLANLMKLSNFFAVSRGGGYEHKQSRASDTHQPDRGDYGALSSRMLEMFCRLRDLKCNVVVTAAEMDASSDDGNFRGPSTVGNFRAIIGYQLDEMVYMRKEGAGDKMKIIAYPHGYAGFPGKSRSHLPEKVENPTYQALYGGK